MPIIDPTLVYDLNLLADIARAATDELQAIGAPDDRALDADRVARIDALTDAAAARLVEVNLVIDGWTERGRNAVVELEEDGGAVVVRSDRSAGLQRRALHQHRRCCWSACWWSACSCCG